MNNKTAAVVTLYNPVLEKTLDLIQKLHSQCDYVILVDNTPKEKLGVFDYSSNPDNVIYYALCANMGIAYAQNYGFMKAIRLGCEFFLTFDQDSTIEVDYVSQLLSDYFSAKKNVEKIAAIGPLIINERNNKKFDREISMGKEIIPGVFSVESIISSGALITLDALTYVGLNKAEWFIDLIDIEWSYRVRYLGWSILSTTNIVLKHNLGQNDIILPGGRSFAKCTPFRLYYVYRNWLFSNREPSFPLKYKIKKLFIMPCKFMIYMFSDEGVSRVKFMLKGIWDGLLGNTGPYR